MDLLRSRQSLPNFEVCRQFTINSGGIADCLLVATPKDLQAQISRRLSIRIMTSAFCNHAIMVLLKDSVTPDHGPTCAGLGNAV